MQRLKLDYYPYSVTYNNTQMFISDWMYGFDKNLFCKALDTFVNIARSKKITKLYTAFLFDARIRDQYPDIEFYYNQSLLGGWGWENLRNYTVHTPLTFKNFLCSFNGSAEVCRKLTTSILNRYSWFDPATCSKNFTFTKDEIYGHLEELTDRSDFYSKFFISKDSDDFFQTVYSFDYDSVDHLKNVQVLDPIVTSCFLNIVSESSALSYYPLFTEKCLHSLVTRGLFLCFAQPGWHKHFSDALGFKKYDKIFDYSFDSVINPVERLVALMCMISKFSNLTTDDWRDLYHIEQDTIEYNYNHYFSKKYFTNIKNYELNFGI
jgi:hypothetical protein